MRLRMFAYVCGTLVLLAPGRSHAQARVNPDISAIGDMRYVARNDVARALADTKSASIAFEELELNFSAYLNPYSRADVFLSTGVEGPVELEEVYATLLRGLPVQARFGKYKLDVGKLNTQHPHQWGWIETPLMLRSFFGPDGAASPGVNVSRLQPVGDSAITLSANAFRADFFAGAGEDSAIVANEAAPDIGYSGRVSFFRSLTDHTHLEVGASYLSARYDPVRRLDAQVGGFDFKLKWRPDTYRTFNLVAEWMTSKRDVKNEGTGQVSTVTAGGAFSAAELRFRKRFDVGGYADWAQDAMVDNMETTAFGGYLGFMPVEETIRFSAVYRHETSDFFADSSDTVTLQVLWAIGPHKPHQF
jgi:hypothetical protein